MMSFSMRIDLMDDAFSDRQGKINAHELANTIRRTAHDIEGRQAQLGDEGKVRDLNGNSVGEWIVQ